MRLDEEPEIRGELDDNFSAAQQDADLDVQEYDYLLRRIRSACAAYVRRGAPFALIIIDIDHFKTFNELHGSEEGDRFLNRFISLLKSLLHKGELLSSYGEDSFAIILRESRWEHCAQRAEEMRLEFLKKFSDEPVNLTISIGVAFHPLAAMHELDLVEIAQCALRTSKREGGNRVTIIPSSSPGTSASPSHVDPPGKPPALSFGCEQPFPDLEISLPEDM